MWYDLTHLDWFQLRHIFPGCGIDVLKAEVQGLWDGLSSVHQGEAEREECDMVIYDEE